LRASRMIGRILRLPTMFGTMFLFISVAIVGNALLMQPRHHPAPLFGDGEPAGEPATADELVRAVQAALHEAGRYSGPLDGIAGPRTREAILLFERSAGRPATGTSTQELLAAIRAHTEATRGAADSGIPHEPFEAEPAPDARTAAVQKALARAAYGSLKADGKLGPATRDAIMRFQRDRGVPVTGEISDALIVELRSAGALEDE
jgi:peptidoglycan hydrolase-like protein with peptidoglycan-binding domain